MQLQEFWNLILWVDKYVVAPKLAESFKGLTTAITANIANDRQEFIPLIQEIKKRMTAQDTKALTLEQSEFLGHFGLAGWIGERGATALEEKYREFGPDLKSFQREIEAIQATLTGAAAHFVDLKKTMAVCNLENIDVSKHADKFIVQIRFENKADVRNFRQMARQSEAFEKIMMLVSRLNDNWRDEDLEIINTKKGSFIVEVAIKELDQANALVALFQWVQKMLSVKARQAVAAEETKKSNFGFEVYTSATLANMAADAKAFNDRLIENVMEKLAVELNTSFKTREADVKGAISRLIKFYEEGGSTDVFPPRITTSFTPDQTVKMAEIVARTQETRRLTVDEVKLLTLSESD